MKIESQKPNIAKCLTQWKAPLPIFLSLILLFSFLLFQIIALVIPSLMETNYSLLAVNILLVFFNFSAATMTWRDYAEPFMQFELLTESMLAGNLDTTIVPRKNSTFVSLADNINALGKMLLAQSTQTEKQLNDHLQHITEKTHSLQVLYNVAASVSQSQNINFLLESYLHTFIKLVNAESGSLQVQTGENTYKIIACAGVLNKKQHAQLLDLAQLSCKPKKDLEWIPNINNLLAESGIPHDNQTYGMICIALRYRDHFFGSYELVVDVNKMGYSSSDNKLLISISKHLSLAINQNKLNKESDLLNRMEERSSIANELHDSLAQTLASLRFQARVLDDSMHKEDEKSAWQEMEKLENSIDQANTELRELIAHFKAPVFEQGLIPAVEQAIKRFRQETGTPIFFQKEWPNKKLPAEVEIQTLRIVQESLSNIRKHAEANAVRVLLKGDDLGDYQVLIEDDGNGFISKDTSLNAPGEHIGLTIMQERAQRIGGNLKIESELGEGTHVMLSFSYISSDLENS